MKRYEYPAWMPEWVPGFTIDIGAAQAALLWVLGLVVLWECLKALRRQP